MKASLSLIAFLINLSAIKCAKCEIEGIKSYEWSSYYYMPKPIDDVHNGLVKTFTTKNILELTDQKSKYLNATFENNKLSITTNEKFKSFEDEFDGSSELSIEMFFKCTEDTKDRITMKQKVLDTNNHDPKFSQDAYEYHLGMSLPEDYDLTSLLKISAQDADFSNRYIYFEIELNTDVVVTYKGENSFKDEDNHYTSFKTLKEIKAPFKGEYTLVATDSGEPARNSTARLTLTLSSNESNEDKGGHPPVFAKHLYFATFTSEGTLKMNESITIKYDSNNGTTIKQSDYQEYFQLTLEEPKENGVLKIETIKPPTEAIIKTTKLLVIEIEAENKDVPHIPGRTALIITLASKNDKNEDCSINSIVHFQSNSSVTLLLFFISIVFIIVITNVFVLIWYFQRRRSQAKTLEDFTVVVKDPRY